MDMASELFIIMFFDIGAIYIYLFSTAEMARL
jgi:hypothetical protein